MEVGGQEAEKTVQRRYPSGVAAIGNGPTAVGQQKGMDRSQRDCAQVGNAAFFDKTEESSDIAVVGCNRVVGQSPFGSKVTKKDLQQGSGLF